MHKYLHSYSLWHQLKVVRHAEASSSANVCAFQVPKSQPYNALTLKAKESVYTQSHGCVTLCDASFCTKRPNTYFSKRPKLSYYTVYY